MYISGDVGTGVHLEKVWKLIALSPYLAFAPLLSLLESYAFIINQ